jgi:hypothetical protein
VPPAGASHKDDVLEQRTMSAYVEAREFTLRLEVRCSFPEDYEGDQDGYAWSEELRAIAADVVSAAAAAAARRPGWSVRGGNRGRSSEDEVTLVLEKSC